MPTSPAVNRQVFLKARPSAVPQAEHFGIRTVPVGALQAGQFLVRNHYLSVDPAMRGWVNAVANYSVPVGIGDVMRSYAAGRVVQSRHPDYPVGTAVMGSLGWQDYAISDGANIRRHNTRAGPPSFALAGRIGPERADGVFCPDGLRST